MKKLLQIAAAASLTIASFAASAHEYKTGSLTIEHPWARVTVQNRPAGGYMVIHNMGDAPDEVVGAHSVMAEKVELHTHVMEGTVMKMRRVDTVEVPAKGQVAFQPGGFHLMIFGLKQPLSKGDALPLTVEFGNAGSVDMDFTVGDDGGAQGGGTHSGHGMSN